MDSNFDKLKLLAFANEPYTIAPELNLQPVTVLYDDTTFTTRIMDRQLVYIGSRGIQYNNMLS